MVENRFGSIEEEVRVLREALNSFDDGVSIYRGDGEHVFSSRASRQMYRTFYASLDGGRGHWESVADGIRHHLPDLAPEKVDAMVANWRERFEDGETYSTRTDDGRIVQITYRTLSNGMKAGISVDVTKLVESKDELNKARKTAEAKAAAKSQFLANMSHEIRTPLNGVLGMAQALAQDDLPPETREKLQVLLESSRTLMTVVNDILDISKIEAGKVEISPVAVDVRTGLKNIVQLYKPQAAEKGIDLRLELDIDLPQTLMFDPVRGRQCLTNLISNAIKFTETGSVRVCAALPPHSDGDLLELRVVDTGIGIDADGVSRLFENFNQVDNSSTRKFGGTGLGLAISRQLARAMGGDVTVESELGRGSTFTLTFQAPQTDAEPVRNVKPESQRAEFKGVRLLLVDDNPINRKVAQMFLRPFGLDVTEASNGEEALAAIEAGTFDIVLMDIHMPVMDGREATKRIRESDEPWRDIPIVALTADAMPGDRERYLGMGMSDYLAKPLEQRELFAVLNNVLRRAREAA